MSETEIWKGLNTKDMKTFELLYEKFYTDLYKYGRRIISDEEVVKDCIHDVFISLYNRKSDFNPPKIGLKPFLLTVLRNKLLDFQKNAAQEKYEATRIEYITENPVIDLIISDEQNDINKLKIEKALYQLSERQREVIHLRYYEGFTLSQIASVMEMNYQSVQNLIQRGLKSLAQKITIVFVMSSGVLFFTLIPVGYFYRLFKNKLQRLTEW